MSVLSLPLSDLTATEALARWLAPMLKQGDLLALQGNLGAGKTTFARTLLGAVGVQGEVPSPTFTLVQTYDLPDLRIAHFDLYRLKHEAELDELGWDDLSADYLTLVEWPERARNRLPQDYLLLDFTMDEKGQRSVQIKPYGVWAQRLRNLS